MSFHAIMNSKPSLFKAMTHLIKNMKRCFAFSLTSALILVSDSNLILASTFVFALSVVGDAGRWPNTVLLGFLTRSVLQENHSIGNHITLCYLR